jgi:putative phosphoesterase
MECSPDDRRNIWVISDTHLESEEFLPVSFIELVNREDLIIHLGDFVSPRIVSFLGRLASIEAVSGNCDPPEIRNFLPVQKILEIAGIKIAMTHGSGGHSETVNVVRRKFEGRVDVALFGHTHMSCDFKSNETLFFNPGSLIRGRGGRNGFGLLHLDGEVWAEKFDL